MLDAPLKVCYYFNMIDNTDDYQIYPIPPSCTNCRHFAQHYIKWDKKFHAIMQGHCLCRRVNDIHCPDRITKCDRWEYNADCRKQKIKSIKQTLDNIEITVRMIAETLTDEELLS